MADASGCDVLEVLDMLPLDVVHSSVWEELPQADQDTLSRVCARSRHLTAQLTTRVTHDLNRDSLVAAESDDDEEAAEEEGIAKRWQRTFERVATDLARLPRLTCVELWNWAGERDLMAALVEYGAGTCGRVTVLTLSTSSGQVSASTARAVSLACPRLRELTVADTYDPEDEGQDPEEYMTLAVGGSFFLPLAQLSTLTKIEVRNFCNLSGVAVRSLGGLSHLRHLALTVAYLLPSDLRHLTGLRSLRHCDITTQLPQAASLQDVSALLTAATQLTHLRLPHVANPADPAPPTDDELDILVQLGGLTHLRSLELGRSFDAGDAAFEALRCLTQLTKLCLGRINLTQARSGHLPRLQCLQVSAGLRPSQLLATLLPLLPLPSLTEISTNYSPQLSLEVGCPAADSVVREDLALRLLAQYLAPQALPIRLVILACAESAPCQLSLAQAGLSLQPLAGRFDHLKLEGFGLLGVRWSALGTCAPHLTYLALHRCWLSDKGLACVTKELTALQRLDVKACPGVTCGGWLGLAAACQRPLRLHVQHLEPGPPSDLEAWCLQVQESAYGQGTLSWEEHEGLAEE